MSNGIGDFVTSIKEARRLMAQVVAELKGDVPGHEFHGNQYSDGGGSGSSESESSGGESSSSGQARQSGGRAPKGGVIGPNDEFYKGGAFVANTTMPKMTPRDKKRAQYLKSRQEVAPGTYENPPSPDHFSVYRAAGPGVTSRLDRSTGRLSRNENFRGMDGKGFDFTRPVSNGYSADELIEKFNSGEKWSLPKSSDQ